MTCYYPHLSSERHSFSPFYKWEPGSDMKCMLSKSPSIRWQKVKYNFSDIKSYSFHYPMQLLLNSKVIVIEYDTRAKLREVQRRPNKSCNQYLIQSPKWSLLSLIPHWDWWLTSNILWPEQRHSSILLKTC